MAFELRNWRWPSMKTDLPSTTRLDVLGAKLLLGIGAFWCAYMLFVSLSLILSGELPFPYCR